MSLSADSFRALSLSLVPGVGPVAFKNILQSFGSMENLWASTQAEFRKKLDFPRALKISFSPGEWEKAAQKELRIAERSGIRVVSFFDAEYPEVFRAIYDPPVILYVRGNLPAAEEFCVAVVGSRVASIYGRRMALKISSDLASAGVSVVSGLAVGIDAAAHEGALAGNGKTYAVLGGGLNKLYPPENKKLAEKIIKSGGVISEYPALMPAKSQFFPVRNRLVSALSRSVLVVEAKEKSGALITADQALEQGRDVFAIPGNADASKSAGTNRLIKEGAKLVTGAEDILNEYGIRGKAAPGKQAKDFEKSTLNSDEKRILSELKDGPRQLEDLLLNTQIPLQKAMTLLSYLEIKGELRSLPGKVFELK